MNSGPSGMPSTPGSDRAAPLGFLWFPGDPLLLVGSDHRLLDLNDAARARIPAAVDAAPGDPLGRLWPSLQQTLEGLAPQLAEGPQACSVPLGDGEVACRVFAFDGGFGVALLPPDHPAERPDGRLQLLGALLAAVPDPLLLISAERLEPQGPFILWANPAALQLTGDDLSHLLGQHPSRLLAAETSPADRQRFDLALASRRPEQFDLPLHRQDGGSVVVELRSTPVEVGEASGAHWLLSLRDVVALRASEEEVLFRAFTDPFSGLPNRRSFANSLAQTVDRIQRSPSQLAVLVVDIDDFRGLTEAFGSATGDRLVLEAIRRLQLGLRGGDVLARSGFDVFFVLAEHVGTDGDAFLLGERLRRCMAQPWLEKGEPLEITVSCGVATSGRRALSGPELLDAAEGALQQVKRDGGDGVLLHEWPLGAEEEGADPDHLSLRQQLQVALRMGGLFFNYQPLVNLGTGRVLGAEALVRLLEEGGKVLPPEAFIPMAQRTGQIKTIDRWVLSEAMNTLRRWRRSGRNLGLAINLSSARLEAGSLVGDIVREAKRAGVSPVGLTLEISETQLFQLKERAAPLLRALREVGVSIALDDFGTGDGGLDWLTALPIDQVKIDRTYVSAMVHDSRCHDLLKEFVRVFLSRGLDVVAEGVETVRQRDMLLAMGCRRGQGWLYGRPTSLEALETAAVRLPSQRRGPPH